MSLSGLFSGLFSSLRRSLKYFVLTWMMFELRSSTTLERALPGVNMVPAFICQDQLLNTSPIHHCTIIETLDTLDRVKRVSSSCMQANASVSAKTRVCSFHVELSYLLECKYFSVRCKCSILFCSFHELKHLLQFVTL